MAAEHRLHRVFSDSTWRRATRSLIMTPSSAIEERRAQAAASDSIRPLVIDVPEAELTEMRRRIDATRWPERETVPDDSQGVPSSLMQELARYWATEYNWRACEKKLN